MKALWEVYLSHSGQGRVTAALPSLWGDLFASRNCVLSPSDRACGRRQRVLSVKTATARGRYLFPLARKRGRCPYGSEVRQQTEVHVRSWHQRPPLCLWAIILLCRWYTTYTSTLGMHCMYWLKTKKLQTYLIHNNRKPVRTTPVDLLSKSKEINMLTTSQCAVRKCEQQCHVLEVKPYIHTCACINTYHWLYI